MTPSTEPSPKNCGDCAVCVPVAAAKSLPESQRKSKASYASLIALLIPGAGFATALALVPKTGRFAVLAHPSTFPLELWIIAMAGGLATLGGLADWGFHRWVAKCRIGRAERRCELIALALGGAPMFLLLTLASASEHPMQYLLPVIVLLIFTTVLICYDEFVFHARRCKRLETVFHRMLVFGNGIAFLAWAHWCFVRSAPMS